MHLRNFTETIWQDLCFGARRLAKSPGYTLTVILTLGLGIGLNSAIFSVVRGILLREPPVKQPERILVVTTENFKKGLDRFPMSPREFSALRRGSSVFEQLAAASYDDLPLTGEGEPQLVTVGRVTPNYFDLLGLSTIVGRSFLASVDVSKQQFDAVISYDLWRDRWGRDSGVIGQTLVLGERNYTVVGVMPSKVKYAMAPCTVWTPEGFIQQALRPKESKDRNLTVLARLRDGVSRQEAEAETTTIFQRLARDDRDNSFDEIWVPRLIELREFLVGPSVRRVLVLLMFVVGLVLLTACANCAGVSLARSTARQNEFAIRVALGAERLQLIQHLLVESALLALFSGGLGVLVALWGVMFLRARLHFSPWAAWLAEKIEVDGMVLFFTFFISCLTVLLFGLMPALRSSRPDPTLLRGSRTASALGRSRIRAGIVIGEVAIAMVLTVSTVASIQLIITEMRPQLGFDPQRVLTLSVALSGSRYNSPAQQVSFFKKAIAGVQTLPGVQFAGATQELPESFPARVGLEIEGHASSSPLVAKYIVSPDYFSVMRIAILKGRAFSVRDDAGASAVAIVNRTFANRFFPNVDPVGARVRTYVEGTLPDSREIVGIVADVIDYVGQNQSVPQIYVPFFQNPVSTMTLVLRTSGDPSALTAVVRNSIWEVDKGLPIENVKPMIEVLERKGAADRLICGLLGAFAGVALCLAAIGIYGLVSYLVVLRTPEIGLRMALGAQKGAILRLVIARGLMLAVMGCALGLVIAIPISRVLPIIRFESSWQGLLVLAIGPVLLIAASVLACCIPARRAMCIDPNVALRYE